MQFTILAIATAMISTIVAANPILMKRCEFLSKSLNQTYHKVVLMLSQNASLRLHPLLLLAEVPLPLTVSVSSHFLYSIQHWDLFCT
jgi:hypothetical protein